MINARRSRSFRALAIAATVGAVALLCLGGYRLAASSIRQALPWSAGEIHELDVDLWPDFDHFLRARIPESGFPAYAARLGLTPHSISRQYPDEVNCLQWRSGDDAPPWWNPSESTESTYVWQENHVWMFAKWERGFVFIRCLKH